MRQLRRARDLEYAANTLEQERRAVHATLMLAAVDHGWLAKDVAEVMGLSPGPASKRVDDARRGDAPTGLTLDRPAPVRGALAEFDTPAEGREWLSRAVAAAYLESHHSPSRTSTGPGCCRVQSLLTRLRPATMPAVASPFMMYR